MSDRYFAKVVSAQDKFTIVINAGSNRGVKLGSRFLVVGLGEAVVDPDTGEELERLELLRGRAKVIHVQEKIATLQATEYERDPDVKEIKKVIAKGGGLLSYGLLNTPQETVTESIQQGEERLKELKGVQIGDYVIAERT